RELKTLLDEAVGAVKAELPHEATDLAAKSSKQSEKSPFFDGLDRVAIPKFARDLGEIEASKDMAKTVERSSDCNDFLLEHDFIDRRERARELLVGARGLSRMIAEIHAERLVDVSTVTERSL